MIAEMDTLTEALNRLYALRREVEDMEIEERVAWLDVRDASSALALAMTPAFRSLTRVLSVMERPAQ